MEQLDKEFFQRSDISEEVIHFITKRDECWQRQVTALISERDYWKDRSQYASAGVDIHNK
jgi:hypothetical protein